MSFLTRLGRAVVALAAVAVLAVLVWFAVGTGLDAVGVPSPTATAVASAAAIAVALVASDVYLPIGGGPRTDVLENRPAVENARDAVLVGVTAGVGAYALAAVGYTNWIGIGLGAFVGYIAFVVWYREEYAFQ